MGVRCLLLPLLLSSVLGQDQAQQQQQFINQLRTQGFTDDQIRDFFSSQQNRQRGQAQQQQLQQPPPQQSQFQQPTPQRPPQQQFQQFSPQQQQFQQPGFGQPPQQQAGFGQPPQQQAGFGQLPPPQSNFGQPPPPQSNFRQPPQQQAGFGQSLQQQAGFGQPPQPQAGFGQPPQPQAGFGQPPQPQAGFGQPQPPVPRQQQQQPATSQAQLDEPPKRSKVFFKVSVEDTNPVSSENYGQITLELFDEVVPKTTRNFVALASGQNPQGFSYKNTIFHRIIPQFMLQGGDFERFDGTGGQSIYGPSFEDENFLVKHASPGLLSMANSGPNTNGAQFFITTKKTPWLDDKHVVFGRVDDQESFDIVKRIELLGTKGGEPLKVVKITDSGIIQLGCSVNGDSRCPVPA